MYIIYRKDYYKPIICEGILGCIMFGVLSYHSIARRDEFPAFLMIMLTIWSITVTLYYLIKYLRKDKDFVVLRIDDNGMLLCQKKNEEVFIEWEKIKHVIFLRYNGGSKVIVRQHNKETYELFFTISYKSEFVMSRGAIKAAYKYTDDRDKIMEVGSFLDPVFTYTRYTTYGDIMYDLYEKERKKRDRERKKRDRERKREREKRLKEKREKREREKRLKEERKKGEREKY